MCLNSDSDETNHLVLSCSLCSDIALNKNWIVILLLYQCSQFNSIVKLFKKKQTSLFLTAFYPYLIFFFFGYKNVLMGSVGIFFLEKKE